MAESDNSTTDLIDRAHSGEGVPSDLSAGQGHPDDCSIDMRGNPPGLGRTYSRGDWIDRGLAVVDRRGFILRIDEPLCEWLESSERELVGKSLWERLKERLDVQTVEFDRLLAVQTGFFDITLLKTGREMRGSAVRVTVATVATEMVVCIGSVASETGEDLAENGIPRQAVNDPGRCQLLGRLGRAEDQLRLLTEQWPGVVFSQRADFSFRYVSPKVESLTGIPVREWQACPQMFWQVIHGDDVSAVQQHLSCSRAQPGSHQMTYRIQNLRTGQIAYVMEHRQANVSSNGLVLGYEGVWLDVTREMLSQRRLSDVAWKETLSSITAGLAHDFGNVMAGIHALTDMFVEEFGADHACFNGWNLIKENSRVASQLVRRIINLHQEAVGESNYHDLNVVIAEMDDLIQKVIPRRMPFCLERCSRQLPAFLDVVEFRQVFLGLVLNAVESMAPDGVLRVETLAFASAPQTDRVVGMLPRLPAVGLSITDVGSGMNPEVLDRIFEPFFTTRSAMGKSGLGLHKARLFVERHNGALGVKSSAKCGSTFFIVLPEADFTELGSHADQGRCLPPAGSSINPRLP